MCSFGSCKTRFEFLSQFRKVRNAFECFVTQVQTRLPKTKRVWPMKINVICTVRSDSLYELAPELQDVMGLRAVRPDAAVAKVMSVCNSRCIHVVTPDDHVTCGYHEILLHDLGDEDLPFVSLSELDYLRRTWPRAVFAFMMRYQQDLELKRVQGTFWVHPIRKLHTLW